MNTKHISLIAVVLVYLASSASAADWFVSTDGTAGGDGSVGRPWDIGSALGGRKEIGAGDTVWIGGGVYKFADRKLGAAGFGVKLAGVKGKPIVVRGALGKRVTIDGGLSVKAPHQ